MELEQLKQALEKYIRFVYLDKPSALAHLLSSKDRLLLDFMGDLEGEVLSYESLRKSLRAQPGSKTNTESF